MLAVLLTLLAASALAWAGTRLGMDTLGHWVVVSGSVLCGLAALYLMLLQPFGHLEVDAENAVIFKVNGTRFKTGKRAIPFDLVDAVEVTDLIVGREIRYAPQLRLKKGAPVLISGPYAEREAAEKVARRMLRAMAQG